jgi:predicted membrane channel-forming protein YqfA (hemolysin III family)
MLELPASLNIDTLIEMISTPSFQTVQLAVIIYIGLLWLSIIVWVTRDAIHRSDSLIFQVIAILLNLAFPVLGILLYLIIRPGKTTTERYYEELEHRLILESIGEDDEEKPKKTRKKTTKKK